MSNIKIVLLFISGLATGIFVSKLNKRAPGRFFKKKLNQLLLLMIAISLLYVATVLYVATLQDRSFWIQAATGFFAVLLGIVGLAFVFIQILEGRRDKIIDLARQYIKQQEWDRAIRYLEEAFGMAPENVGVIQDLCEAYIIKQNYEQAADFATMSLRLAETFSEKAIGQYLLILNSLAQSNIGTTADPIKKLVDLYRIGTGPRGIYWSFKETDELTKKFTLDAKTIINAIKSLFATQNLDAFLLEIKKVHTEIY